VDDVTVNADGNERIVEAVVRSLDWVSHDTFLMSASWNDQDPADRASGVRPGQFFLLRAWEDEPLLSRPMSVFDEQRIEPLPGDQRRTTIEVSFLCTVRGRGTEILSRLPVGAPIRLIGPLGNGWPLDVLTASRRIALVGGGCGVAPLYPVARWLAERSRDVEVDGFLGFRGEPYAGICDRYRAVVSELIVTLEPDPQSSSTSLASAIPSAEVVNGRVTDVFDPAGYDFVLACGPRAMLAEISRRCIRQGVSVYVSLEERMACGVGACLGCAVNTIDGVKHVCKDGPVFRGDQVVWNG